jgi:hypothetical protein
MCQQRLGCQNVKAGPSQRKPPHYFAPRFSASQTGFFEVKASNHSGNPSHPSLFPPPERPLMRKSEYASHRGVGPSAITRALKEGRLVTKTVNGKELIDVVASDAVWQATTRARIDSPGPAEPSVASAEGHDAMRAARLRREQADASLRELALERERGTLIARRDVKADLTDAVAVILSAWDSLPDRLSPLLVGLEDQAQIRAVLRDEIEQLQHRVAEALTAVGDAHHHETETHEPPPGTATAASAP